MIGLAALTSKGRRFAQNQITIFPVSYLKTFYSEYTYTPIALNCRPRLTQRERTMCGVCFNFDNDDEEEEDDEVGKLQLANVSCRHFWQQSSSSAADLAINAFKLITMRWSVRANEIGKWCFGKQRSNMIWMMN